VSYQRPHLTTNGNLGLRITPEAVRIDCMANTEDGEVAAEARRLACIITSC